MAVGNCGILTVRLHMFMACCYVLHTYFVLLVAYHKREEPKLLLSHDLPVKGQSLIAISPDALTVAVAIQRSIYLYGCSTGALLETMPDCHEG